MMLFRKTIMALVCMGALVFGSTLAAANDKGLYIGGAGGLNFLTEDSDLNAVEAEFEDFNWAVSGALGYALGNGLRLETEVGYRPNDVDNITGVAGGSGDVDVLNWMFNALYDLDYWNLPVKPYVGAGIGIAHVDFDGVTPVAGSTINDSDIGFAFQGIAGLSLDLTENLAATLDYRHLRVPNVSFRTNGGTNVDSDYATNQIMIGLRYTFGAPPKAAPAPVPVKQPAPAPKPAPKVQLQPKEFIVFFDFDQAKLTPEAQKIVNDAAAEARKGYVRIKLSGHADRAGSSQYNVGLSQRRADSVMSELRRLGVSSADIATEAKGEAEPLVPTADGVPEPQNRRVEIMMQ
jgi:outer membrane protein OmpA-like peptidoglycan-associated protein